MTAVRDQPTFPCSVTVTFENKHELLYYWLIATMDVEEMSQFVSSETLPGFDWEQVDDIGFLRVLEDMALERGIIEM